MGTGAFGSRLYLFGGGEMVGTGAALRAIVPLDVDVAAANRLELVVDFSSGDAGCAVRFEQPVFER